MKVQTRSIRSLAAAAFRYVAAIVAFAMAFMDSPRVDAADILRVFMSDGTIAQFDTSLATGSAIQGSKTTWVSGLGGTSSGDLITDTSGNFYAGSDNKTIKKITPAGAVSDYATLPNTVRGMAFDNAGNLYAAVILSGQIYKIDTNGSATVFATVGNRPFGVLINGTTLYNTNLDQGGVIQATPIGGGTTTTFATLGNQPRDLVFDSNNDILVLSTLDTAFNKVSANGSTITPLNSAGMNIPFYMTFDSQGFLWISNFGNNTVGKYDTLGNLILSFSPGGTPNGLAFVTVPEPSAYILAGIAAAAAAALARRRNARKPK